MTAKRLRRLNANLVGDQTLTKTGEATLKFDGDNSAFTGQIVVAAGILNVDRGEAFGSGGFLSTTKTTVQDGATLQLTGPGLTSAEHFHIQGTGTNGQGAIHASRGDHLLAERIALRGDTTIRIDRDATVTFGGDQGRFYNAQTLTKIGEGLAVFDQVNNIAGLTIAAGGVAGGGGINGSVVIQKDAILLPGDSATAFGIGSFATDDLTIHAGGKLQIDLDAGLNRIDVVTVAGQATLAGILEISLRSAPTASGSWVFLDQDGIAPVFGAFANSAAIVGRFGGNTYNFAVNYLAGSGNDAALVYVIPEPTGLTLWVVAGTMILRRRR